MPLSVREMFMYGCLPSTYLTTCPFIDFTGPCAAIDSYDNTYLVMAEGDKGDGVYPAQDLPQDTVVAIYTGVVRKTKPKDTRYLMSVPQSKRGKKSVLYVDAHRRTTADINGMAIGCHNGGFLNLAALINEPSAEEVTNCAFMTVDDRHVMVVVTADIVYAWTPLLVCYYGEMQTDEPTHNCDRSRCKEAQERVKDWAERVSDDDIIV